MVHSVSLPVCVALVLLTICNLSAHVHSLPVQNSKHGAVSLYKELENVLNKALLSNLASDSASASFRDLRLSRPGGFPRTPTDTPSLTDLMRSAVQTELKRLSARKAFLLKRNGGELLKRSFDSISRSSGFGGMQRGSWGGNNRSGDNLTFTFESLFPAIARGLRSIN